MFFSGSKIIYLSMYQNEEKGAAAGFVQLKQEGRRCCMILSVNGMKEWPNGSYPLFLVTTTKELPWGDVCIRQGSAQASRFFSETGNILLPENRQVEQKDVCGLYLKLNKYCKIATYHKTSVPEPVFAGYARVHPFDDDSTFIMIEPSDFDILGKPYCNLKNNSFLLHGFYNYRHIILGPIGSNVQQSAIYSLLGVPGTYYEREKMVATMFGFDTFRCEGKESIGSFGYYLKQVKLS